MVIIYLLQDLNPIVLACYKIYLELIFYSKEDMMMQENRKGVQA
jgi:hypothetical protein